MSEDYSQFDTKMQGVDIVLAMPQWYINYNLDNLLREGKTKEGGSLREIDLAIGEDGQTWLHGKIAKMWTEVFVNGAVQRVKFILQFEQGQMDYYDIATTPPTKEQADIEGLQFGFEVNLSYDDVVHNQDIPEDVRKRVEKLLKDLGEGAFTVRRLLMDFENAVLSQYDPTVTKFPRNFPPSAVAAFPNYMDTYMRQLQQAGGNILGYAVKVNNPGGKPDPVATFPPTDLQFATNRYHSDEKQKNPRPDLDTIQFLMMTEHRPFPSNLNPWWGNYVVPGQDERGGYGTMAIAKSGFVHAYLLKHLAGLTNTYWDLADHDGDLDPHYETKSGAFTPTPLGGSWKSGTLHGHSHVTHTLSNDDVDYHYGVTVNLEVKPGTNQIVITRKTDFDIQYTHWYGIRNHAIKDTFQVWYSVPLTITISLLGVHDGALKLNITSKTKEQDPDTVYADPYGWLITKHEGSASIWKSVSDTMTKVIDTAVNQAAPKSMLPNIEQKMKETLSLDPFVFPGGNQLFMADPVFNHEGDLLIGLQYKQ